MTARSVSALMLLLLAACATQAADDLSIYPELKAALAEFRVEQKRFLEHNGVPQAFDFPGAGRVSVRDVRLEGYPGNSYVRCRFVYQNTTGKPVVRSWVSLDVLDSSGNMVASKVSVLIVPVPMPIADGSYFSDELSTRTMDAHLLPGWSWRITCRSQLAEPETEGN